MNWVLIKNKEDLEKFIKNEATEPYEFIHPSDLKELNEISFPFLVDSHCEYMGGNYAIIFSWVTLRDAERLIQAK